MEDKISVIIPTYKNKKKLLENLEHNYRFLKNNEIIIINDFPSDNITKDVKKIIKECKVINNKRNLGFAGSVNRGIENATSPFIMLLNSDVVLKNNNYLKALKFFENDKKLFAVTFAQIERDGMLVGKNMLYWKDGLFHHKRAKTQKTGFTAWAEGGASIFDKEKVKKLGKLDQLYNPFYWEDIDLSYKAWRAGYKILFVREIEVIHQHEGTIGKYFSNPKIKEIAYRNQLIFTWKNIPNSLILNHLTHLPFIFFNLLLKERFTFLKGFFSAIILLSQVIKKRIKNNKYKEKPPFIPHVIEI